MNIMAIYALKILRKLYAKSFGLKVILRPNCEEDPDKAAQIIYEALIAVDKPCMIARFGGTEMACLCNYLGVEKRTTNYIDYIRGIIHPWWWDPAIIKQMQRCGGFFPPQKDRIEKFCELMFRDIPEVDILGSWLPHERYFEKDLQSAKKIRLSLLDPFWAKNPWTRALEGKKVLVVHPFAQTIEKQYKKRELLFKNNLLPKFEIKTIKAVQSIAGEKTEFVDWFEALEHMKLEIDKVDYDICLIGCGAYGFPLASHVKRRGKKSVHLGGSLQLLFGIKGKRWGGSYSRDFDYASLSNEHWTYPSNDERPCNVSKVEDACYW